MEGLNIEDALIKITSKLPSNVRVRWSRFASKMLKSEERLATFHVVEFVTQEAALATDPVFSPEARKEARKSKFTTSSSNASRSTTLRNNRRDKSTRNFSKSVTSHKEQPPPCSACPFCNSQHHNLENCSSFKKMTLKERKAFAQEARICFGCLCHGHMSRKHRNRKVCKTCSMSHPTILHDESKVFLRSTDYKVLVVGTVVSLQGTQVPNDCVPVHVASVETCANCVLVPGQVALWPINLLAVYMPPRTENEDPVRNVLSIPSGSQDDRLLNYGLQVIQLGVMLMQLNDTES